MDCQWQILFDQPEDLLNARLQWVPDHEGEHLFAELQDLYPAQLL